MIPMCTSTPIRPLAEMEREAILTALSVVGNSTKGKMQAARLLGIGKTTLYRKLKDLPAMAPVRAQEGMDPLLHQAAALRTIPVRTASTSQRAPLRFLQIPRTLQEQEQASLRCPKCRTALIDLKV
jgi:Bacterial regulatory protein, Fis family